MSERSANTVSLDSLFDEWNAEFDKIETQIGKTGADPAVEFGEVIASLRNRRINFGNSKTKRRQRGDTP